MAEVFIKNNNNTSLVMYTTATKVALGVYIDRINI
jgi:hypothetical protein